jgi:hypothetical protein
MHNNLGHFGEKETLVEIKHYYWHNQTKDVKVVVSLCQQFQMVKKVGNICFKYEELKNILVCELFYKMALAGPFLKNKIGNKYILVAIDNYSKWCEAKVVLDHEVKIVAKFLEKELVCTYDVPKFIFTGNWGGEGVAKFDVMCKDYGIIHQYTTLQWPQCNKMINRIIKIIKHGIIVMLATLEHIVSWDKQLARVLFNYCCKIQASTKFSPFMILTRQTSRLRTNNYLQALATVVDDTNEVGG